jgi:hypothetical protein
MEPRRKDTPYGTRVAHIIADDLPGTSEFIEYLPRQSRHLQASRAIITGKAIVLNTVFTSRPFVLRLPVCSLVSLGTDCIATFQVLTS